MLVQLGDKSVPEKRTENETPLKSRADETGRVISSPAHSKTQARHVAKGKVQTASMKSIEAEAVTIGLPYLKARETIQIENVGKKFSGSWRITKVRHEISNGGYTCTMTLSKNDHETSTRTKSTPKQSSQNNHSVKSAGEVKTGSSSLTKPKKITVDLN